MIGKYLFGKFYDNFARLFCSYSLHKKLLHENWEQASYKFGEVTQINFKITAFVLELVLHYLCKTSTIEDSDTCLHKQHTICSLTNEVV